MFNPAAVPQAVHMILAALMVASFLAASVYAVAMLRGRRDRYHRIGLFLPLTFGVIVSPFQVLVGDYLARFLATNQPAKLAAIEGVYHTGSHVPLTIGGIAGPDGLRYGLEIPDGLSLLVGYSPNTVIQGLDRVPVTQRPPVTPTHLSFDVMVGIGFFLLALGVALLVAWWVKRRRGLAELPWPRPLLLLTAISGVASVVALECGWVVTEEGRQPWIVVGFMSVRDAVNPAPGLMAGLWLVLVVYAVMTVAIYYVLRRLARVERAPIAPQEPAEEFFFD
jgi:cytochrome d ubiquinol oxidase subunit I